MKVENLTLDKAEQTPTGGALVGKREGQTIIHEKGTLGGYLIGKLHKDGGIKAVNKSTGQPLEMQGGEIVITAPAVSDNTKRNFNGKMMTNREILSEINEKGGGVSFAKGGELPSEMYFSGEKYKYGGELISDHEIAHRISKCGCEHDEDLSFLEDIDKMLAEGGNVALVDNVNEKIKIVDYDRIISSAFNKEIGTKREKGVLIPKNLLPKLEVNKDNFFLNTEAHFKDVTNEMKKNVKFDFESSSGSQYLYTKQGVYRKSDHWGWNVASCDWTLDSGNYGMEHLYGKSNSDEYLAIKREKGEKIGYAKWTDFYIKTTGRLPYYDDVLLGKPIPLAIFKFDYFPIIPVILISEDLLYLMRDIRTFSQKELSMLDLEHSVFVLNNTKEIEWKDIPFKVEKLMRNDPNLSFFQGVRSLIKKGDVAYVRDVKVVVTNTEGDIIDISWFGIKKTIFDLGGNVANRRLIRDVDKGKHATSDITEVTDVASFIMEDGGGVPKIKIHTITINTIGDRNDTKVFNNFKELSDKFKEDAKGERRTDWETIVINGADDSYYTFGLAWHKYGHNTVLTFNPNTAKPSDYVKVIKRKTYLRKFEAFDWDSFFYDDSKKRKPNQKQEAKSNQSSATNDSKFISEFTIEFYGEIPASIIVNNIKDLFLALNDEKRRGRTTSILLQHKDKKGSVVHFSTYFRDNESEYYFLKISKFNIEYLISKLKQWFPNQIADSFFEEEHHIPTEPKTREKGDYLLERKYLKSRILALSIELDLKRPSLSNAEIGIFQREINKITHLYRLSIEREHEEMSIEDRITKAFSLKWGDFNEEYKATDMLSINGMKSELTDNEFATVRTDKFKAFFGDWEQAYFENTYSGVSKLINPLTKEPLPVFHGTNVLFKDWKVYDTNNAHYFAVKREMSNFFATSWESRSDKAAVDSAIIKKLNPNKGNYIYRCFLDIKNPIDFSRFGIEKRPVRDYLLFLKINYNIGDYEFWTNINPTMRVTEDTLVYAWQIIRLWQSFTNYVKVFTTYDGYIFYELIPSASSKTIDDASLSFCAFESNQVKFSNATEFNSLSDDSRFLKGGKL